MATPIIGTYYNEPGEVLGCEDYRGLQHVTDGGTSPYLWLRMLIASSSATGAWHTPQAEVELYIPTGRVGLIARRAGDAG